MAVTLYAEPVDLDSFAIGREIRALLTVAEDDLEEGEDAEQRVKDAIAGASRTIDSYLRGRYSLPLLSVGDDIRRACAIIAAYDALTVLGYNVPGADAYRLRYAEVIRWLERVAEGRAIPDVTDSSTESAEGRVPGGPRITSSSTRGWSNRGRTDPQGGFSGD